MLGFTLIGLTALAAAALPVAALVPAVAGRARIVVALLTGLGALAFAFNVLLAYERMGDDPGGGPRLDYAATTMLGGLFTGLLLEVLFVGVAALVAVVHVRWGGHAVPIPSALKRAWRRLT
jgi:hypothetical protein